MAGAVNESYQIHSKEELKYLKKQSHSLLKVADHD
jgi:hypothetical protein